MKNKSESPMQQIKRRFRKNKLAIAGWYFIVLAFFVAIFVYVLIPDRSPMANRMHLSISNQPPGFKINMLAIPKDFVEETGFFSSVFFGRKDAFDYIPVTVFYLKDNYFYYHEFTGELDSFTSPWSKIQLSKLKNPYSKSKTDFLKANIKCETFLLGTDRFGRDLLSRLLAGSRVTLSVGLAAVIISLFIGLLLGSLAGYFRGKTDSVIVWLINVVWSIPTLLLVISIMLVLGKGFQQVFIAVGLTLWVDVARAVRSQFISISELDYVSAGKALGFRNIRLIGLHMLPNVIGPVLVITTSNFSTAILLDAGLSFLGIGVQPPVPSWGSMIKENFGYIIIPGSAYLAILPGLAIMLLTMAFAFVANGLRYAIDSKTPVSLV